MQEDRLVFCPQLVRDRLDTAFFGVFDGTVGAFNYVVAFYSFFYHVVTFFPVAQEILLQTMFSTLLFLILLVLPHGNRSVPRLLVRRYVRHLCDSIGSLCKRQRRYVLCFCTRVIKASYRSFINGAKQEL